jgi:hypothetical protein
MWAEKKTPLVAEPSSQRLISLALSGVASDNACDACGDSVSSCGRHGRGGSMNKASLSVSLLPSATNRAISARGASP